LRNLSGDSISLKNAVSEEPETSWLRQVRKRFGIESNNSAITSRIIKETLEAEMLYPFDPKSSRKFMKYIPWWAK